LFKDCKSTRIAFIFTVYPRAVAAGCIASMISTAYNIGAATLKRYDSKMGAYGVRYPMGAEKETLGRYVVAFVAAIEAAVILPINVYRVVWIHGTFRSSRLTTFFTLMYLQNVTVCVAEVQFFARCVRLYLRFREINEEISALKSETIVTNWYPVVLKADECEDRGRVDQHPLVNVIERLKLRHKYMSNAVRALNELYNTQLGLSLMVLFLMTLFDMYEFLSQVQTKTGELNYYCLWMVQYSFRFCVMVTTTHVTTKEVWLEITICHVGGPLDLTR
jgi:hypothetical protein